MLDDFLIQGFGHDLIRICCVVDDGDSLVMSVLNVYDEVLAEKKTVFIKLLKILNHNLNFNQKSSGKNKRACQKHFSSSSKTKK